MLLIFGLLFLCLCSTKDEENNEKKEKCWTCVQREVVHNRNGNLVSNTVLVTIETCKESEKNRLEDISSRSEYDCVTFSVHPYKQCGSKYVYYSCYEK